MGDENSVLTEAEARHFLRRATFSPDQRSVDRLVGKTRGYAAARLLRGRGGNRKPRGKDEQEMHDNWVNFCLKQAKKIDERLVLFWHDHFATSNADVNDVALMAQQNQLLRMHCKGNVDGQNFKDFVKAINKDPAMMEFLDTTRNTKTKPNENYGRELQELFTLGVFDLPGAENYDQADIVQIARAFTGWGYDAAGHAVMTTSRHDFGTPKIIFQTHGMFGGGGRDITENGTGEVEIDTVIDIIFEHRDSAGKNTVARHIAYKLLSYFVGEQPDISVVDDVVAASDFDGGVQPTAAWNLNALLRAILVHDFFYATVSQPASVKWPIHYVVEALSLCGMKLDKRRVNVNGIDVNRYHVLNATAGTDEIRDQLDGMGQRLLAPPSVFGWDWENAWINSGALLARYDFAVAIAQARGRGRKAFRPDHLINLSLTDAGDIVDAVAGALAVQDRFPSGSPQRTALINYVTENGTLTPPFNLFDQAFRDEKLNGLFTLVLQSPAFQLQ